ncbi:SDR family NAD(P)-dependent oxidoreductase [Nocardia sp. NBC_00511]|uniref:SDR family NAD(P)-dependent oxidoreductase n=1 Tax=Nocardia sp. NBC_00511 TaxID=2903591 RepID=UPI0030E31FAA
MTATESELDAADSVAVVGMACRFPGARDVSALWQLLIDGRSAIVDVPSDRWDTATPWDPVHRIQPVGGFIDCVGEFDAGFFGISPREAREMDPQQRLMLETCWRALEDGGVAASRLRGRRVGVYVGASWHDYEILRKERGLGADRHSAVGGALDIISSRVSYFLGLTGPSLTVETGCSSALVALDLAVRALRSGDIDAALVGGVNLILAPDVSIGLTHFGGLSPDGRCAAFAATANGFVRGEGVAAVFLERWEQARRDGDRVRAVIVETAVNNDGGGESLVTPNPQGQRDLLRRAYRCGNVPLERLAYLEAHGTGTSRGDPIEAAAIGEILGVRRPPQAGPLLIGSVKTNIGHLEAAAGIAGLIKCVLCAEHRSVPASLHAHELNPGIPFELLNLKVVRERTDLAADGTLYLGVNSFGWGGTNAHVVLRTPPAERPLAPVGDPGFVPVSAHSESTLRQRCRDIADSLTVAEADGANIVAALADRTDHHTWRCAVVGADPDARVAALRRYADDPTTPAADRVSGRIRTRGRVAFVFPGQGSQWHGMAAGLYGTDPAFTDEVDACAEALAPHVDWEPIPIITGGSGTDWLERVDQVQPVLWAVSMGLAASWRAAGVEPDAVIGHSQGEITAAAVAGHLTRTDAALLQARRSRVVRAAAGTGKMLAIEMPVAEIPSALDGFADRVSLAVVNGPTSCVLSGEADAVDLLRQVLEAEGVFCRPVNVDYASHSVGMTPLRKSLSALLSGVRPQAGTVEMMSTTLVRPIESHELTGEYWVENLCRPVLFADAMAALFDAGVTHAVEISPHPILSHAVQQLAALRPDPPVVLPSLHRGSDPVAELTRSRALAFVSGLAPFGNVTSVSTPLPGYPLQPGTHWLPDSRSRAPGPRTRLTASPVEPGTWQCAVDVGATELPWLVDHRVDQAVVAPGALLVTLALSAATELWGGGTSVELTGVEFRSALTVPGPAVTVHVVLREDLPDRVEIDIRSQPPHDRSWTTHAQCSAERNPDAVAVAFPTGLLDAAAHDLDAFYHSCAARGLGYGPDFRCLRRLFVQDLRQVLAAVELGEHGRAQTVRGSLHPVLLDNALQAALAVFDDARTLVPVRVASLRTHLDPAVDITGIWSHVVRRSATSVDIQLFDLTRRPLASIVGLEFAAIERTHDDDLRADYQFRLSMVAVPAASPPSAPTTVAVAPNPVAAELIPALRRAGAEITGMAETDAPAAVVVFLAPPAGSTPAAQSAALLSLARLVTDCASRANPPRLVIATDTAQAVDRGERPDAGGAMFWGFGRVLRREHPVLRTRLVDLASAECPDRWNDCAAEVCGDSEEDQVLLRAGGRFVARLVRDIPAADPVVAQRPWTGPAQPFQLRPRPDLVWDGLRYRPLDAPVPGPGEVVVRIRAAGLNFIDVLTAAGTYPDRSADVELLGIDCAGVVTATGPGVVEPAVGAAVIAYRAGALASHIRVRADHTSKVPAGLPFPQAAALPLVTATAWYGLVTVARLQPGETVLIHSGTGGLGLAAIAVARRCSATVIATAGSPERRQYLRDNGIEHVFDSRSPRWVTGVRAATAGRGVDVVLNSLTGAGIQRGLAALAEDGRFIEVGKQDIHRGSSLPLGSFAKGISFSAVDLAGLMQRRPERFATLVGEVWAEITAGRLPTLPVTEYSFAEAAEALRELSRGAHIGKFVLTRPESITSIEPEPMPGGRFRAAGTYLVTGGHGALGLSLAEFLVDAGAGAVLLVGRSVPGEHVHRRIARITADRPEAVVRSVRADVCDRDALADVLRTARTELPPLRGVFHAAGVLDDATVLGLQADRLARVLAPKVDGVRNLDELTAEDPLDLFVLFSSAATLIGNPGQAAYAAANAYLDAFAQARRFDGRPALSIQWGPVAEVGLAAATAQRGARLAAHGMGSLPVAEVWAALRRFLTVDEPVMSYVPLDIRQWLDTYPDTAAQPSWERLRHAAASGRTHSDESEFMTRLDTVDQAARQSLVGGKIRELAGQVLRLDPAGIDGRAPFKTLGLDSLLSLELRNRLESAFGLRLSPTLLWTYGSSDTLAGALCDRLGTASATAPPTR